MLRPSESGERQRKYQTKEEARALVRANVIGEGVQLRLDESLDIEEDERSVACRSPQFVSSSA